MMIFSLPMYFFARLRFSFHAIEGLPLVSLFRQLFRLRQLSMPLSITLSFNMYFHADYAIFFISD
jgi:hypothetical protein